jgi:hypothetical protein
MGHIFYSPFSIGEAMKARSWSTYLLYMSLGLSSGAAMQAAAAPQDQAASTTQNIPAFTAYAEPNAESMEIAESGPIDHWTDAKTTIAWYGIIRTAGKLDVAIRLTVPQGETVRLKMEAGEHELAARTVHGTGHAETVSFGAVRIDASGGCRIALTGLKKSGASFGSIDSLLLSGEAANNALFNHTPQRGAPSVHLNYPIPDDAKVEWFYNEVTAKTDPISSYYEACGFARGYFGIQVNSPTERRIIFSVWDAGKEAVDRSKVAADNQVQLIAKGDGVYASGFGNEGTGGHSHLVYPWKTGDMYRFLVHAKPEGESTVYSAYFYFPEKHAWGLIASFRAPRDGHFLSHLYSFNEDFDSSNGQQVRLAEFGNQWIRTTDGKWTELTQAHFTHTARGKYSERIDRSAGVVGDRFYLTAGGFKPSTMEYGDLVSRPASAHAPDLTLPDTSAKK